METQNSYQRWDDVVFEHRNKLYGAYAIRKSYPTHVLRSGMFCIIAMTGIIFYPRQEDKKAEIVTGCMRPETVIETIPPTIIEITPPVKPSGGKPKGFAITPTIREVPEDTTSVTSNLPSTTSIDQTDSVRIADEPFVDVPVKPLETKPLFVLNPEIMPAYEGGLSEMMKFLQRNLRYPSRAVNREIEGTVFVSFVVGTTGSITLVEIIKGVDTDLDREAVRVISLMNKWKSGMQNNTPVPVKMVLPVKFSLGK